MSDKARHHLHGLHREPSAHARVIGLESSKPLSNKTQSRGRPTFCLPIEHKSTPDQHCMLPCHGARTGTHGRQAPPLSLSERCQRLSALHVAAAEHAPTCLKLAKRAVRRSVPSARPEKSSCMHSADDRSAAILVPVPCAPAHSSPRFAALPHAIFLLEGRHPIGMGGGVPR
jgi:hypothetical protein